MFTIRFDLRNPEWTGHATPDLFEAAVDMASYAEANGCLAAVLSEHHTADDGHLSSPIVLAAGIAARTRTLQIMISALLVPLHDPIRLAEDMVALDLLSRGRVSYVAGLGYRPEEFEMFGQTLRGRALRMEACLTALNAAFTGDEFVFEGRTARVTPKPYTPGGPPISYGGGSAAAARRAAAFGLGFFPQSSDPELIEVYERECERLEREPGPVAMPSPESPTTVFVSEDVDATWDAIGENMLHDAMTHAEWMGDVMSAASSHAKSVAELRSEEGTFRVVDPDEAIEILRRDGFIQLHPLCGGASPHEGWKSLHLLTEKVLPAV